MSNSSSTEKTPKLSEQFDFNVLMKVAGDRKRLYSVTHAPNKSGMCRVASLDQGEVKIVHQRNVKNLQRLCDGKAGLFFDKFDEKFKEARLVVPDAKEWKYPPTFNKVCLDTIEEFDGISAYNSELFINYFFYMNQLLAMSKKEDKSNNAIQLENE
jgi:hypothetical protein